MLVTHASYLFIAFCDTATSFIYGLYYLDNVIISKHHALMLLLPMLGSIVNGIFVKLMCLSVLSGCGNESSLLNFLSTNP